MKKAGEICRNCIQRLKKNKKPMKTRNYRTQDTTIFCPSSNALQEDIHLRSKQESFQNNVKDNQRLNFILLQY